MTDTNTAQMVADLTSTNNAVLGNGWVSPELGGSGGSLDLLGSALDPLSGLASAGLGWFTSFVSFLGDGLTQLQGGDPSSVTSGSQDFGNAGQDITNLAGSYGGSVNTQTANWTGAAASDYRNTGTQAATGVAGLGTASTTVGSSIIGAGQVVAEAIAEVTELISEAVAQIVPILTQAVARASQTFGESVVEAIPPCVGIAVEYAAKIAAKLAALLASGQNLLKLVQGALGVVDLIQQALSSISQQSTQGGTDPSADQATSPSDAGNALGAGDSAGPTAPMSTDGGAQADSGGVADSGGSANPSGSADPSGSDLSGLDSSGLDSSGLDSSGLDSSGLDPNASTGLSSLPDLGNSAFSGADPAGLATQSSGVVPAFAATTPSAAGVSAGAVPGGAVPVGAAGMGLAAGARSGAWGGDTARSDRGLPPSATSTDETQEGVPLGGMGGARAGAGEKDKEHKRKYSVIEQHDEVFRVAPPVIGSER